MTEIPVLTTIGDIIRLTALFVFLCFALVYGFRTSWEKTQFGRHMMQSTMSHILILSLATGFTIFDPRFPGYQIARIAVFLFVLWVAISRFRILSSAQKSGVDPVLPDEPVVVEKLVAEGEVRLNSQETRQSKD